MGTARKTWFTENIQISCGDTVRDVLWWWLWQHNSLHIWVFWISTKSIVFGLSASVFYCRASHKQQNTVTELKTWKQIRQTGLHGVTWQYNVPNILWQENDQHWQPGSLLDVTHLWPASCCMDGRAKKLFIECEAAEDKRSRSCSLWIQAAKTSHMHKNLFSKVQSRHICSPSVCLYNC